MLDWMHCIATTYTERRISYYDLYFPGIPFAFYPFLAAIRVRQAFDSWQLVVPARRMITNFVTGGHTRDSWQYSFLLTLDG